MKIQPQTMDLSTMLWGINTEFVGFIPQSLALRSIVLLGLNFNISKLVNFSLRKRISPRATCTNHKPKRGGQFRLSHDASLRTILSTMTYHVIFSFQNVRKQGHNVAGGTIPNSKPS